ncbi:MAG: type II secretion system protein GspL [Gallionella sp.]|nr:type II secretion system protein GspL [Gallionella sp.]
MSTLYIRLPSKAAAGNAPHWPGLPCPFALVSHDASIVRQGVMPLPDLSGTIAKVQRVVLLLAAGDVTLLRVKVPPLSPARLKAALPNLVEDQLIADLSDCVVVAGGLADGLRTAAVAQRAWLDTLARTLIALGAHQIAALPAQLCLPYQSDQPGQPGSVIVAVNEHSNAIDMTFRLSEHDGIGLAISTDPNEPAAREAIQALCAVVPEAPISLYVPQSGLHAYQKAVNDNGAPNKRISVLADNWSLWISGANGTAPDLMAGPGAGAGPRLDLRAWRWPLALAAAVMAINVAALNIDWWRMKAEANSLRAAMTQIYKSAFPKETVIIDPVAQMRRKIAAARHDAGLAAADDFTAITATFGEAWASVATATGKTPDIAALEYRERSLLVRLKPFTGSVNMRNDEALTQQMKAALAERNLSLDQEPSGSAAVWKIRSAK